MEARILKSEQLADFETNLKQDEKSSATLEKYMRDVRHFAAFANGQQVINAWLAGQDKYALVRGQEY